VVREMNPEMVNRECDITIDKGDNTTFSGETAAGVNGAMELSTACEGSTASSSSKLAIRQ